MFSLLLIISFDLNHVSNKTMDFQVKFPSFGSRKFTICALQMGFLAYVRLFVLIFFSHRFGQSNDIIAAHNGRDAAASRWGCKSFFRKKNLPHLAMVPSLLCFFMVMRYQHSRTYSSGQYNVGVNNEKCLALSFLFLSGVWQHNGAR